MSEGRQPIDTPAHEKKTGQSGAGRPAELLDRLLSIQCRRTGAVGGALLRLDEKDAPQVISVFPSAETDGASTWIQHALPHCRQVIDSGAAAVISDALPPPKGAAPNQHLVLLPVKSGKKIRGVAAFVVPATTRPKLAAAQERLKTTSLLLNHLELKLHLDKQRKAAHRLHLALDSVSALNQSNRFTSAAMTLCNELAEKLDCIRVSIGFLEGRYVRLQAMSRTDTFRREMKLIQAIEAAMEECLDQDLEVLHPPPGNSLTVSRAAGKLAEAHGPAAVLTVPVRTNGETVAVMAFERSVDRPFSEIEEIEAVRLACDLCAPRLVELKQKDRWFGARAASWGREKLAALLGPRHTWMKLSAGIVFLFAGFLVFAKGDYRIEAPFLLEATVQQSIVAPFDSFLKSVSVEPGDAVTAGQTVLGELETAELRLKLAALKAEQLGYEKERASSMRDGKTAEAQIAEPQIAKLAAEIRLVSLHIEQAALTAPITGRIVSENRKRQLGLPVEAGDLLFEIAGIGQLRAELYVPEESISEVRAGQSGELASVAYPDLKIPFVIERINPMAEVVNQKNVFAVRARLLEKPDWMRPGMEGIAKISAGRKHYAWIWTHRISDWLRMKLWL